MAKENKTKLKIKEAAQNLFIAKGLNGTTSRDIAEASGVNLALINYHFQSKENLFRIIMLETFQKFIGGIAVILNNPETTFEYKIENFVSSYIDLLIQEQHLPNFIIGEIRKSPDGFLEKNQFSKIMMESVFIKQLMERNMKNGAPPVHPLHYIMNLMSLTVMPFVARPMIQNVGSMSPDAFNELMEERKKLIPQWIQMI